MNVRLNTSGYTRALLLMALLGLFGTTVSAGTWDKLENARLDTSGYLDGDSFTIRG